MSRRALRQIDPALDLSRHLRTLDELRQPFCAEAVFERAAPLEIEVGSGKGLFLATTSGQRPERNFLGCEVSRKFARFAAAKLARRERRNAIVLQGDAQRLFLELPADSAQAVHVYFPDPWWKKRHLRRRIMNARFVRDLERVLVPQGVLHFWTDVAEYYQATLDVISSNTHLEGPFAVPELPAHDDLDFRTHFERRMRLHEVDVYRAEFRRQSSEHGLRTAANDTA